MFSSLTKLTLWCSPRFSTRSLIIIICVNDFETAIAHSSHTQFADDTTIFISGTDMTLLYEQINQDLSTLAEWFRTNKLSIYVIKTYYMIFGTNV